jgi:YHS domain-containing protein
MACPVTGEPLGSMDTPIPVTVKGQTIYVCCRGCVAKVQANPDFYLQKVQAEREQKVQTEREPQSHGTSSPSNSSSRSSRSGGGDGGCCHGMH